LPVAPLRAAQGSCADRKPDAVAILATSSIAC